MSCDYAVWSPAGHLSAAEAGALYAGLCDGTRPPPPAHPGVEAFYRELTARHPELDDVPPDRVGDTTVTPWSCAMDRSAGHVVMSCVWPEADRVGALVESLARKHGLAFYDPQGERFVHPDDPPAPARPWWRFR